MNKINFESTQLILVNSDLNKCKYLEKLSRKSDNKLGISFKHLPREGLRTKNIERINQSEEKIKNITPEYVLGRYKDIFLN